LLYLPLLIDWRFLRISRNRIISWIAFRGHEDDFLKSSIHSVRFGLFCGMTDTEIRTTSSVSPDSLHRGIFHVYFGNYLLGDVIERITRVSLVHL
jgi:hypothetical protein